MPVNESIKPVISESLKRMLEGSMQDVVVVDGRPSLGNGLTYGIRNKTLDRLGINNIPSVNDPDFGKHLTVDEREKFRRKAENAKTKTGKKAVEIRTAFKDTRAALEQEQQNQKLSGRRESRRGPIRQLATMIPFVMTEGLIGDPVATYQRMANQEKPGDLDHIERTTLAAFHTALHGINVQHPNWAEDLASAPFGWLTIPIDVPVAGISALNVQVDPEAAKMYGLTAGLDVFTPITTPGISAFHTRYGLNVHRLVDQALHTENMYNTIVQDRNLGSVNRGKDYYIAAQRIIDVKGEEGMKQLHKHLVSEASRMRKEMGVRRTKVNRNELLNLAEFEKYRTRSLNENKQRQLVAYTIGAQIEAVVDRVNLNREPGAQITYK